MNIIKVNVILDQDLDDFMFELIDESIYSKNQLSLQLIAKLINP